MREISRWVVTALWEFLYLSLPSFLVGIILWLLFEKGSKRIKILLIPLIIIVLFVLMYIVHPGQIIPAFMRGVLAPVLIGIILKWLFPEKLKEKIEEEKTKKTKKTKGVVTVLIVLVLLVWSVVEARPTHILSYDISKEVYSYYKPDDAYEYISDSTPESISHQTSSNIYRLDFMASIDGYTARLTAITGLCVKSVAFYVNGERVDEIVTFTPLGTLKGFVSIEAVTLDYSFVYEAVSFNYYGAAGGWAILTLNP